MNYLKIDSCDLNNGDGTRVTLWVSGCDLYCEGCHNYESWNFKSGKVFDNKAKDVLFKYLDNLYVDGLSILGGEALHKNNVDDIISLCEEVRGKFKDKSIWVWTGYTVESLEKIPNCDILIDGKYEMNNPTNKKWRGSDNQRMFKVDKGEYILID